MSYDRHPLIDLLKLSGFDLVIEQLNFQLFTKLKDALTADNKSIVAEADTDVLIETIETLSSDDTNAQGDVLRGVIENWCLSVLTPLLDALNEFSDTESIYFSMDNYLYDATISLSGDIEGFADSVEPENVTDLKELLADWENTLDAITNSDELLDAINALPQEEDE